MAQTSIESFFPARKRPAPENLSFKANKVFIADETEYHTTTNASSDDSTCRRLIFNDKFIENNKQLQFFHGAANNAKNLEVSANNSLTQLVADPVIQQKPRSTRSKSTNQRILESNASVLKASLKEKLKARRASTTTATTEKLKQQNLVKFIKQGNLSPHRKKLALSTLSPIKDESTAIVSGSDAINTDRSSKIQPVSSEKPITVASSSVSTKGSSSNAKTTDQLGSLVKKELNFDEVKSKISRSAKLQELKASIGRLKELEKARKLQEEKSKKLKNQLNSKNDTLSANLKKFNTIELEVLTSPQKGFKTPTKPITTTTNSGNKNELMSPRKATPKRVLFSPSKGSPSSLLLSSPSKSVSSAPAYERYLNLVESGKPTLQLPYKYRCLIELFKCIDSVCAMFYNRKETITFKKLKPAVQRMARKNFTEEHLAQIKHLYPEAFQFQQVKTRNFGSTSKLDYFQLVITPVINSTNSDNGNNKLLEKIDEDNVLKSAQATPMNPQVMIERLQKFINIFTNIVKDEHDKFLKTLNPPMNIPKDKIKRWHPEFDLEKYCPDIEKAQLPKPPNIEHFSSAKDVLSTARNLFNCATPMERALKRLEEKKQQEREQHQQSNLTTLPSSNEIITATVSSQTINERNPPNNPVVDSILKNVPKSLLEKIRAKQAAKALDSMTRSHSQEREATKYSRLPDLARHLRNVFITEKKGVLPLEIVLKKIENSYRTFLTQQDIEHHLKLMVKELPEWVQFHEIRKTTYLKLNRDMDLARIVETLTNIANERFK